jgi:hypothetical protein
MAGVPSEIRTEHKLKRVPCHLGMARLRVADGAKA